MGSCKGGGTIRPRFFTILVIVGAVVGLMFAWISTRDFASHLDRQVHDVSCSFVPGLAGDAGPDSGCQATLMSPYSSVLRTLVWGGIPVALPGMAVFAFLLFFALEITLARRQGDARATLLLALATAVPAVTSLVMAIISLVVLGATCKLCVGIYAASALCLVGGIGAFRSARHIGGVVPSSAKPVKTMRQRRESGQLRRAAFDPAWTTGLSPDEADSASASEPPPEADEEAAPAPASGGPAGAGYLAAIVAVGILFVAAPVVGYASLAPDHARFIGSCGALSEPADSYQVMVPIGAAGDTPAIEVLDPLCPACRAFETRLEETGLGADLGRTLLLFPLDDECNWMVDDAVHPGACAVSEAILCAGNQAPDVLAWAFANQEEILETAKKDRAQVRTMITEEFRNLRSCVGGAEAKAKVNKSLRWAVSNSLPLITPQLYVAGVRLCDEDVDLGLDFALSRMIDRHRAGQLTAQPGAPAVGQESATDAETLPPAGAGADDSARPAGSGAPSGDGKSGAAAGQGSGQSPAAGGAKASADAAVEAPADPGSAGDLPPPEGEATDPSGGGEEPAGDAPPAGGDEAGGAEGGTGGAPEAGDEPEEPAGGEP